MDTAIGQKESIIHIKSAPVAAKKIKKQPDTMTDILPTAETTITKETKRNGHGIGSGTGDTRLHTVPQATILEKWAGTLHAKTVAISGITMESRAAMK